MIQKYNFKPWLLAALLVAGTSLAWALKNPQAIAGFGNEAEQVVTTYGTAIAEAEEIVDIYGNVVPSDSVSDVGTIDRPLTVSEVLQQASSLEEMELSAASYYVTGRISNIKYVFDSQYGTATFTLSENDTTELLVYGAYFLDNQPWVYGNTQIQVGDSVIVFGQMTNYKGQLEMADKKSYICSLNGMTHEEVEAPEYPVFTTLAAMKAAITSENTAALFTGSNLLVTNVSGDFHYVSDGTDGFCFYGQMDGIEAGDRISITIKGELLRLKWLPQMTISEISELTILSRGNDIPAQVVTIEELKANYTNYEDEFVALVGVYPESSTLEDRIVKVYDETGDNIMVRENSYGNLPGLQLDTQTPYVVMGFITGATVNGETYIHLYPRDKNDIVNGTLTSPFTPYAAYLKAKSLEMGQTSSDSYYVSGIISSIKYTYSAKYGTATFNLSADGQAANSLQVYSAYYLENRSWTDNDTQIQVGDSVMVYGQLMNYKGTPEMADKKSYIYSLNGFSGSEAQRAQGLSIEDFTIETGATTQVAIHLNQDTLPVLGFQADIILPQGLTLAGKPVAVEGTLTDEWGNAVTPTVTYANGKIVVYNNDGLAFNDNTSAVVMLKLKANSDFAGGVLQLNNIVLSGEGNVRITPENVSAQVTSNYVAPEKDYEIYLLSDETQGVCYFGVDKATPGTIITGKIYGNDGYEVANVSFFTEDFMTEIPYTVRDGYVYSFEMPESNVYVLVSFKSIAQTTPPALTIYSFDQEMDGTATLTFGLQPGTLSALAFQANVNLPNGVSVSEVQVYDGTLAEGSTPNAEFDNGRLLVYNTDNVPFNNDTIPVASLLLNIPSTFDSGTISVTDIIISGTNNERFTQESLTMEIEMGQSEKQGNYNRALASVEDGGMYHIFTYVDDNKYYLNEAGYIVSDPSEAACFTFTQEIVSGTMYASGWNLGYRFTNPRLSNGATGNLLQLGRINVSNENDRYDWERQVLFQNEDGLFAIRATNARSDNWGANTYWNVVDYNGLPTAGYSLEMAYIWHVEYDAIAGMNVRIRGEQTLSGANFADIQPNVTLQATEIGVTEYGDSNAGALTIAESDTPLNMAQLTLNYNPAQANYRRSMNDTTWPAHYNTVIANSAASAENIDICMNLTDGAWNFICLPYDVRVSDITCEVEDVDWVIRTYDGALRAAGQMSETWVNVDKNGVLEAGKGYIMHCNNQPYGLNNSCKFHFPAYDKHALLFTTEDITLSLEKYDSEFSQNRNWNFIGNPYAAYIDILNTLIDAPITVWNGDGSYSAYSPNDDHYILTPGEAFFVQCPDDENGITFDVYGRMNMYDFSRYSYTRIKSELRTSQTERSIYNFILSDGERSDRTRIVVNESALMGYEMNRDACKFAAMDATAPQLFSVNDGVLYAINERPLADGSVLLSARFGKTGTYVLSLDTRSTGSVILTDNLTGAVIELNGTEGYTFTAEAGNADQRFRVMFAGQEDGIGAVKAAQLRDGDVYTIDGKRLSSGHAVNNGIYLIKKNGVVRKVSVK